MGGNVYVVGRRMISETKRRKTKEAERKKM